MNSNHSSSVFVIRLDHVEFQTTHGSLYDIVQAIRRKNERMYPRMVRVDRDLWSSFFIGILSKVSHSPAVDLPNP